jgi:hypothetical protein
MDTVPIDRRLTIGQALELASRQANDGVLDCPFVGCEKSYVRRAMLAAHLRVHTGASRQSSAFPGSIFFPKRSHANSLRTPPPDILCCHTYNRFNHISMDIDSTDISNAGCDNLLPLRASIAFPVCFILYVCRLGGVPFELAEQENRVLPPHPPSQPPAAGRMVPQDPFNVRDGNSGLLRTLTRPSQMYLDTALSGESHEPGQENPLQAPTMTKDPISSRHPDPRKSLETQPTLHLS